MSSEFNPIKKKIPLDQILFWVENPRLLEFTRNNTELQPVDIKNYFLKKESVEQFKIKELAQNIMDIKMVHDPLHLQPVSGLQNKYILFEGNRRLAALYYIQREFGQQFDDILNNVNSTVWENLSDINRDKLLANWHEEGKLEWTPFARGLKMKNEKDKKIYTIKQMEEIYKKTSEEINQIISATNFILKHRLKNDRFSHSLELQKVKTSTKKFKDLNLDEDEIEKFETKLAAEFKKIKGSDVRTLTTMYKKAPGRAKIKAYIKNDISYQDIIQYSFRTGQRSRLVNKFEQIADELIDLVPDAIKKLSDKNHHEISYKIHKKIKIIQERLKDCQNAYKNRK